MNILGNSLEEIALEKAGIIKPAVPVVIGEYLANTKNIFAGKAKECNSKIYFTQDEYEVSNITSSDKVLNCDVKNNEHNVTENFSLDLNGIYQTKNLCTVLCAEGILIQQGFKIKNESEKFALANTKKITGLHGRWDVIAENPTVVLDVAHNEDGIKQVLQQTTSQQQNYTNKKLHFVLGMVKDKEVDKVLSLLPTDAIYYFTNAHIPRAITAKDLQAKAVAFNLTGEYFDDVNKAIIAAKQKAASTDLIIVCGSVFLVGEVDF
jgi:dihydrofolate synthase/folylpolyglutamate synthase